MLKLNKCYDNKNMSGTGLNVSVEGMSVIISKGTFRYFDKNFQIPEIEIPFDVMDIKRNVNIFLVDDIDNPIRIIEELDKTEEVVHNPIYCITSFYILEGTTDLSDIDIDFWQFGYEKEVDIVGKRKEDIIKA